MGLDDHSVLEGFSRGEVPKQALTELEAAFGARDIAFDNVIVRTQALGTDILGDASWTEFNDDDSRTVSHRVLRTFMFFHRPDTTLPEFSILAKRGVAGRFLMGITAKLVGMPTFELEDEPGFNDKFTVVTANPESVRVLLVRDMVDAMVAIENLNLSFMARGLLFTRHPGVHRTSRTNVVRVSEQQQDERVGGKDRQQFIEDAVAVCAPVANDPDAGRRAADAVDGTYAEEAFENLTEQGGLAGQALKKMVVTLDMLAHLERHPVPRLDVPGPVRRRAWAGTTFPLILLGILSIISLSVGTFLGLGADGPWWVLLLAGLVLLVVFGLVMRHRLVRKRIVTHGRIVPGRISSVEKTDTSVNDDVIHKITVQPQAAGEETVVAKMGSQPAKAARRMMESNQPTWVLVDPEKPGRGLWPHGWTLEAMSD
tara:strand:- start:4039 stop:5319 length:1281 start_codon:yes stop_codon:yes gene_type:complete